jgi:CO/xanthine dehydrogenase Mo-binding subunit
MTAAPSRTRLVSSRFPPGENLRFVAGHGRYLADLELPGQLHLAVLSSPHAHARIMKIDASKALAMPGVMRVLTGAELAERLNPIPQNLDIPRVRWFPLAVDKVRFLGEWVAAVVATSRYLAEDAVAAIDVEYERLPAVVEAEAALDADAPLVHEEHGSNLAWRGTYTWGEVDEAFAAAAHRFEYRYYWSRHSGVPLETFGALAAVERSSGIVEVWASHQTPDIQQQLAHGLKLPMRLVRVHQDLDVGGSYGTKRGQKQMLLVCAASMLVSRPVKFIEDRLEYMRASDAHGPERIFKVKLASDPDGRITALDLTTIDDNGAYVGRGPLQMAKPITAVVGPYRIPAVRYSGYAVITNKNNQSPYRGFGQSPHNFVLERCLDRIAARLGLDPAEIRLRNYIPADAFPYEIPSGAIYDSGDYPTVLRKALDIADYEGFRRQQTEARAQGRLVGIGIAGCVEPSGGNTGMFNYLNPKLGTMTPEGARVQILQDGTVVCTLGFQSTGQSHETMVAQVLGDALEIAPDIITTVRADSLSGVPAVATIGSRMSLMLTTALLSAATKLKEKLRAIAAHNLEAPIDSIVYGNGRCFLADRPDRGMSLAQLAWAAYKEQAAIPPEMEPGLVELAVAKVPGAGGRPDEQGKMLGYPSFAFSVHLPRVEVDPQTGLVQVLDYAVAHDCGTVINPQVVAGMVYGGIAHGLGAAFYEDFKYDSDGQLLSQSFMDYLVPSSMEMPPIRMGEHVTPSPVNPLGAKGTAEGGYMTAPAALASAVEDALRPLGVTIDAIPMSPERLLELMKAARESSYGRGKDD